MIKSFNAYSPFYMGLPERLNEGTLANVNISNLDKIINTDPLQFLRDRMWKKTTALFYGADFTGDPMNSEAAKKRIVYNGSSFTTGSLFKEAWTETDDFCKLMSTYAPLKRLFSKTFNDEILKWIGNWNGSITDNYDWNDSSDLWASSLATGKRWSNPKDLSTLEANPVSLDELSIDSENMIKMLDPAKEKETLDSMRKTLHTFYDFEADWGLDGQQANLQGIRSFNKKNEVKDVNDIGYWFTYHIAKTYLNICTIRYGALILKAIATGLKDQRITVVGSDESTPTENAEKKSVITNRVEKRDVDKDVDDAFAQGEFKL